MKKPKKTLSRLETFLTKEIARIQKIVERDIDLDSPPLTLDVIARIKDRLSVATADLAAIEATKDETKKAAKTAKPTPAVKPTRKNTAKAAPKKTAAKPSSPRAKAKTPTRKTAPARKTKADNARA